MKLFIYISAMCLSLMAFAGNDSGSTDDSAAEAEPDEIIKTCGFKIECRQNEKEYAIEYRVLGDGCDDNSAGEFILIADEKRTALQIKGLPLKKFEDKGNLPKVCEVDGEKYPAVDVGDNRLAIFIRIDNRPGLDRLGGLVIDLNRRKVIKLEPNFGEIKNQSFAMLKRPSGIKTMLAKDRLKDVHCDCDAAVVEGWKEIIPYSDIFKTKWIK